MEPVLGIYSDHPLNDTKWYPDDYVVHGTDAKRYHYYRTFASLPTNVSASDQSLCPEDYLGYPCIWSQRGFGWDDVQSTREDVVAAAKEENSAELLAIMPEARSFLRARAFASSFRRSAFGVAGCPCRLQAPVLHRKYEHTKGAWSL